MAQYDTIVKYLMDLFPYEYAVLALDIPDLEVIEKLNTEQPTVEMHHNDVTFKIRLPDGEVILHIEAQTDDSRAKPMPLRVLAYASFLLLQHEMPVYSIVLYFRPPAGRDDPGHFGYERGAEFGIQIRYKVIRLYALEGEPVLDAQAIGLLPFTPLMTPPPQMPAEAWVRKCVEAAHDAPVDETTRATLLFAMSVFGSFVHPAELFTQLIKEESMQISPFYQRLRQRHLQEGIEQGIEQGARQNAIENTLAVLMARFPQGDVNAVKLALEAMPNLERLKELNLTASLAPSFEAFLRSLEV